MYLSVFSLAMLDYRRVSLFFFFFIRLMIWGWWNPTFCCSPLGSQCITGHVWETPSRFCTRPILGKLSISCHFQSQTVSFPLNHHQTSWDHHFLWFFQLANCNRYYRWVIPCFFRRRIWHLTLAPSLVLGEEFATRRRHLKGPLPIKCWFNMISWHS